MDMEQEELQFLGLFGIYKESFKLILKCRKIFTQITLTLILPLSIIFLSHEIISRILYYKIAFNEFILEDTKPNTPAYTRLSDVVSREWAVYILFKVSYFTPLLIFSLLATSAVVYAVASVYTSREIEFKKVMGVVPRVWKRLMVTFLFTFLFFSAYTSVFGVGLYLWEEFVGEIFVLGPVILVMMLGFYCIGFVYMTVTWQLASVISVLEDSCGIRAVVKSRILIRGKLVVVIIIFLKLIFLLVMVNFVFSYLVSGFWGGIGSVETIGFEGLCVLILLNLVLFGLVVQTVIYFVCKSYHHENIDKSALSDHLEVYLGDYVPLIAKDVQLQEYR